MTVDGEIFEETSQTLSVDYLAFSTNAVLLLGGVTAGQVLQPECPVRRSLVGGISRLLVNSRSVLELQWKLICVQIK